MNGTEAYERAIAAKGNEKWDDRIETNKSWIFKTQTDIARIIERRRRQILVHSYIYYVLDNNIISDSMWSLWAKQLYNLQNAYPYIAAGVVFDDVFRDFDYSTGSNLVQYFDREDMEWVAAKAEELLNNMRRE